MKPTCTKLRASKTVCDDVHWIQIKTTAQRIHKIILIKYSTEFRHSDFHKNHFQWL